MAKKNKTVDEIISDFQKNKDKGFEDRIKAIEELHHPQNDFDTKFGLHAQYTVWGKPSDRDNFPGAYEESYKVLDNAVKGEDDKLEDIDQLTSILEKYVDVFLEKAMGEKFKDMMKHAKKEGLEDEKIRELKGSLFSQYFADEEGNTKNILNDQYIKQLKGKKKIYLIKHLQSIAKRTHESYARHLGSKAIEGLFKPDEDRLDFAKYAKKKFDKAGFEHEDHPLTKNPGQLFMEYLALHKGKDLSQLGYKKKKQEKEELREAA